MPDDTALSGQKIISFLQARKIAQEQVNASITQHIAQLELDKTALSQLEQKIASGISYEEAYAQSMTKASTAAKEHAIQTKGLSGTTDIFVAKQKVVQAELKATAASTKLASIGVKALSAAFSMFASVAITWGVSKLIEGFNYLAESSERAKEKLSEIQDEISNNNSTYSSNRRTLEGLKDEYDDLSKKANALGGAQNLTNDEYKRYQDITSQILGITPQLITGWNDEGQAISNKNDLLQASIDLLDEEYEKSLRNNTTGAKNKEVASGIIAKVEEFNNGVDTTTMSGIMADIREQFIQELKKLEESGMSEHDLVEKIWTFLVPDADPTSFLSDHIDTYDELRDLIESDYAKFANSFTDKNNPIYELFSEEATNVMLRNANEYFEKEQKILEDRETYYQEYKDQLSLNAQATQDEKGENVYKQLSENGKAFINEYINGLDYASIKTEEDFVAMANDIQSFTKLLASNEEVSKLVEDIFSPPKKNETSTEYVSRIQKAIEDVQQYCTDNYIDLPIKFTTLDDVDTMTNRVQTFLIDEFDDRVGELSLGDLQIASDKLKIDPEIPISWDELIEKIKEYKAAIKEEDSWDFKDTIKYLDTAKEKLSVLDETYSKLFDGDKKTNIGYDDYSAIADAFSDVTGIENYVAKLQEAGQDAEKVAAATQDLVIAYLNESKILDNVTDDNKELIASMLGEVGITNATELVTSAIERYEKAQRLSTLAGYDLANATAEDINSLTHLKEEFINAGEEAYNYYLNKKLCSETGLDTAADCEALIALAKQCQVTGENISVLTKLKNSYAVLELNAKNGNVKWGDQTEKIAKAEIERLEEELKSLSVSANVSTKATYNPKNTPGTKTNEALEKANDAMRESKKVIDFFEERIKKLNNALELLETNLENVTGAFAKNNLIDAQIGLNAEKVNNYTDALAMYTQKANEALSKLPSDIADKLKNGAVNISEYIDDEDGNISEAISNYQNWAEKIAECKQELASLKEAIRDLELAKFNNIMQDFTDQFDLHEGSKDLIDKQIDLFKEAGQLIGESFYQAQIDQTKKQLALLEEEKKKLSEQMTSAVTSGRVNLCPAV